MITRYQFENYIIFLGFMTWFVLGVLMLWYNLTLPDFQEWFYIQTGFKLWEVL